MFNLSGSELIFMVVIALVVLGPDKLPEAMRKAGKAYADFKRMTSGFQSEMKSVLDEPMRELRETAELAKNAASWDTNMFNPASPSANAKSAGGPTDLTGAAAATSAANGSAPPVAAATPVAAEPAEPVTASNAASPAELTASATGTPADTDAPPPSDATSRRLARQHAPELSVSTAPLPVVTVEVPAEPVAVQPTPDAIVASGMMTGFGSVPAEVPADTDEVAAE